MLYVKPKGEFCPNDQPKKETSIRSPGRVTSNRSRSPRSSIPHPTIPNEPSPISGHLVRIGLGGALPVPPPCQARVTHGVKRTLPTRHPNPRLLRNVQKPSSLAPPKKMHAKTTEIPSPPSPRPRPNPPADFLDTCSPRRLTNFSTYIRIKMSGNVVLETTMRGILHNGRVDGSVSRPC